MLRKIIKLLATMLLIVNFNACSSDENESISKVVEKMILYEIYTLNIGDEINRTTDDAQISITKNSENNDTQYILIIGAAEILRK